VIIALTGHRLRSVKKAVGNSQSRPLARFHQVTATHLAGSGESSDHLGASPIQFGCRYRPRSLAGLSTSTGMRFALAQTSWRIPVTCHETLSPARPPAMEKTPALDLGSYVQFRAGAPMAVSWYR